MVIRDRRGKHSPLVVFIWLEWYCRPPSQAAKGGAEHWSKPATSRIPSGTSIMPRLRGKSRRGAAWYRAESRRKRIQHFERAITLASKRRKRSPWSPPMAIIEEISLEEAMQSHPPMARAEARNSPPKGHLERHTARRDEALFPTCVVEEEVTPTDATGTSKGKRDTATANGTPQYKWREEHDTRTPGDNCDQEQATFSALWHLPLIFELRSMLDDLAFRLDRVDQRMDMLFAALSKSTPKKHCPTCAQVYAIPAGWRRAGGKRASTG
jgi:hypothetical protein